MTNTIESNCQGLCKNDQSCIQAIFVTNDGSTGGSTECYLQKQFKRENGVYKLDRAKVLNAESNSIQLI